MTERDVAVVRWLGRHRLATAELVMERFGMQRSKTYQRLAALTNVGLVRHEVGVRTSRVYLATARGLAVTGLDLPTGRVSAATFAHDLAVVRAAIPLERSRLSAVLTEREFRRLDQDQPGRFRITHTGLPGSADQRGLWPDIITIDHVDHSMHAVEVELTQKKRERVAQKMHAYAASQYSTVTYICGTPAVARVVRQAAIQAGLIERVRVETLAAPNRIPQPSDELERLLELIRSERSQRRELEERAEALEAQLDRERHAGFAIVDDIDRYLTGDRAQQRAIRSQWIELTERVKVARSQGMSFG